MEGNKSYIILAVVVLLGAGFFGYRHFTKNKDSQAHNEDKYRRLVQMAQKSPRSGMLQMAKAIKKYHAAKKSYPNTLDELYPDYIQSRSFIDDIHWSYRAGGNDFQLSKSIERGGKTLVASTDASLKTRTGTGAMLAGRGTGKKRTGTQSSQATSGTGSVGDLRLPSGMDILAALRTSGLESRPIERPEAMRPIRIEPRIVEVDTGEPPSDFASDVSRSYLVWRDANGHMGYGNVQYPDAQRLTVADQDRWLNIVKRPAGIAEPGAKPTADQPPASGTIGEILAAEMQISGGYMAWKDRNGVIGFGNVQLPEPSDIAYILVDGAWQAFEPAGERNPVGKTL